MLNCCCKVTQLFLFRLLAAWNSQVYRSTKVTLTVMIGDGGGVCVCVSERRWCGLCTPPHALISKEVIIIHSWLRLWEFQLPSANLFLKQGRKLQREKDFSFSVTAGGVSRPPVSHVTSTRTSIQPCFLGRAHSSRCQLKMWLWATSSACTQQHRIFFLWHEFLLDLIKVWCVCTFHKSSMIFGLVCG